MVSREICKILPFLDSESSVRRMIQSDCPASLGILSSRIPASLSNPRNKIFVRLVLYQYVLPSYIISVIQSWDKSSSHSGSGLENKNFKNHRNNKRIRRNIITNSNFFFLLSPLFISTFFTFLLAKLILFIICFRFNQRNRN